MTSQYGAYALRAGVASLYARMRMHTPTRPGIHMHARTRVKHAHTDQYVMLIAFPQQQWFSERSSMYRHIACIVAYCVVHNMQQYTYTMCTCIVYVYALFLYKLCVPSCLSLLSPSNRKRKRMFHVIILHSTHNSFVFFQAVTTHYFWTMT